MKAQRMGKAKVKEDCSSGAWHQMNNDEVR